MRTVSIKPMLDYAADELVERAEKIRALGDVQVPEDIMILAKEQFGDGAMHWLLYQLIDPVRDLRPINLLMSGDPEQVNEVRLAIQRIQYGVYS